MTKLNINQWPETDRPRERMLRLGPRALSNSELLAILIGSGSTDETAVELSRKILRAYDDDLDKMCRSVSVDQLCSRFKGIGPAKAVSIMAALELGRRRRAADTQQQRIQNSQAAYEAIYPDLADLACEEMWVITLNKQSGLIAKHRVGQGGLTEVVADVRQIVKLALLDNALRIVLAHNHPSGGLQPSSPDRQMTRRVQEACRLFNIDLTDHIIVGHGDYYSFADHDQL